MKKLLIYIFYLSLLLNISCQSEKKKQYTIGVSQCSIDLWRETANNEMLREASFYPNLKVEIKSVNDDTQKQIEDIETFIREGVDLLVVSPNEGHALTSVIEKAYNAGIPVILLDRKIESDKYTAYVGADNYQLGYEAGLYVAGILKSEGNVVEMHGLATSTADMERHQGFSNALSKYPDIKIVAEGYGAFRTEDAQKEMAKIINDIEHIDLVFAFNDPMALGVSRAYEKYSGKRPYIVGVDAIPDEHGGVSYIQNNVINASLIYPTGGADVIDLAQRILTGQQYEKENTLYTAVVDKSNVRMLQLQTSQIYEHQEKLVQMNDLLNKSIIQYSNQRTLFFISIGVILIFIILSFMLYLAYRGKTNANIKLEKQNDEIKRQADILTEQKEQLISLSRQLEDATHAKLVFFTNISHEFKTPLSLILGPVETLLTSDSLTKEQYDLLELVNRSSKRLLHLISEIIEFRSFENGKMKMDFSKSDIKEFINDITPLFHDYIRRKHIILTFNTEGSDFEMVFDKEKVEKIYYNLLSNALKHVNTEGEIKVGLKRIEKDETPYVQLSVFNSGSYISPGLVDNIFDRFYKIDPNDEGTGIGLALTSTLVEAHKGTIKVDSEKNKGTDFIITLPVDQKDAIIKTDSKPYETIYTTTHLEDSSNEEDKDVLDNVRIDESKPLVLIIEDNPDMRIYMHTILNKEYAIIEAADGDEGLLKARKYVPDLIISDVMMPKKDGFEVCRMIKENMMTSHIPVILLTAYSMDEQKTIGFESGADAYIPKPFNAGLLKIRVRKLIENRQKMKEAFGSSLINDTKKESIGDLEQVFLDKFKDYIEEHISNPDLSIEDIAKDIGLSKSQLYRKIKSLTNYSPNELIRIIRLKYARILLSKNKSVSEVAYEAGFSSPSYFTKCFKEFYNENPTNYVNRLNSEK